jgi:hypothetical protein
MKRDWTKWILTTTILSMSLAPAAAYADESQTGVQEKISLSFTDLAEISPQKLQVIQEAVDKGFLAGFPDGQFHPKETLSRQELAVLLTRALNLLPETNTSSFSDTSESWASSYIEAARKAGLMNGDSANSFRPTDPVTREEMATVFVRAVKGVDAKGETAIDLPSGDGTSSWANDTVKTSVRMGLVVPTGNGFDPKANINREDIAAYLVDIFKKEVRTSVINKIDGDFVTIDGQTMLIEGPLKALFAGKNKEALEGAILKFTSLNKNVDGLAELEIVNSGSEDKPVSLDTSGSSFNGVLRISGDYVAVSGNEISQVEVKQGAKHVELNAQVKQLEVLANDPVKLTGNAQITTLKVNNDKTQITLGEKFLIDTVQVPSTTKTSNIITNYGISKEQIKNREEEVEAPSSGSSDTDTPVESGNQNPTVVKLPKPMAGVAGAGETDVDFAEVFADPDGDTLTFTAESSDPTVASVRMEGTVFYVTPLVAGTATLTITASDGKGGSFGIAIQYIVEAAPPVIPPFNLPPLPTPLPLVATNGTAGGSVVTVDASQTFLDEDVNSLAYSAESSDTNVATVSVSGTTISLTPVAAGIVTITLTATDAGSLTTQRTFSFTVLPAVVPPVIPPIDPPIFPPIFNFPPLPTGTPLTAADGIAGGSAVTVDASGTFTDEQVNMLTYSAVSSNTSIATVSVSGSTITLTPVAAGSVNITLTAMDVGSLTGTRIFTFTVTPAPSINLPPIPSASPLAATDGTAGGSVVTVDASGAFFDDNTEVLTIDAVSSDTNVASVYVSGSTIYLTPLVAGTVTVMVTATDEGGLTAQRSFSFTVTPAPGIPEEEEGGMGIP